jgi:hypothetical protein
MDKNPDGSERTTKRSKTQPPLPEAGDKKKDPEVREKLLDKGVADSMDASDPPAAAQPEVKSNEKVETKQPKPPTGENPDWLLNPPKLKH